MRKQAAPEGAEARPVLDFKAECVLCKATGIHRRDHDPEGVGFVCYRCNGTGHITLNLWHVSGHYWDYEFFSGRKIITEVRQIYARRGLRFINNTPKCVPWGTPVSYDTFLAGAMPTA